MRDVVLPRRWLRAAAFAAALAVGAPASAPAGDSPVANPLPRFLEAAQVGPAAEYRFVVVHPILVPPPGDDADASFPGLAADAPRDLLGVPTASRVQRTRVRLSNLGGAPLRTMPGDLWRVGDGDFAATADVVLPANGEADVPVLRVAPAADREDPPPEPRAAGALPGPALMFELLSGTREVTLARQVADLARDAGLADGRRSPADLAGGKKIAARVDEYRRRLAALPRPGAAGRRAIAGYAVVLDGGYAGIEVFGDPAEFARAWPGRLQGIAVEAALLEAANGSLDEKVDAPADTDRFTTPVKDAILALYGLEPKATRVPGLGTVLELAKGDDVGRAVVDRTDAVRHLLWLRDPAARHPSPTGETPDPLDPGVLGRKARLTEFEKRWLERRRARTGE